VNRNLVLVAFLVFLAALSQSDVAPVRAEAHTSSDEIGESNDLLLAETRSFVEGSGTSFDITNSEYLNISLMSSEMVYVILESVPKMVSFIIEGDSSATSTILSFTGFQSDTTYYRYQDGNLTESFTTDSDGNYSYAQEIASPHHVFIVENAATIYIRPDGTVYSDTGQPVPISVSVVDGVYTYSFTGDISETIVVQRSNVVIEGNGHTLEGSGSGNGFYVRGISGMTIKNVIVKGWTYAVALYRSSGNNISGNTINNTWGGIQPQQCSGDTISGNTINNNTYGIRPRYRCSGYNISGNTINNSVGGIYLWNASGTISANIINNSSAYGIHFDSCYGKGGNNVSGNTISNNALGGISLAGPCRGNSYFDNTIYNNGRNGIALWKFSCNNSILGNTINNNTRNGIYICSSTGNNISRNTIQDNNWDGVSLVLGSSGNNISGNTINNNRNGIILWGVSDNTVYHNNIIDNSMQAVDTDPAANDWHHPDLLEGNYWSDYPGVDDGSGTGKHAVAGDGIGDTHTPWPTIDYDYYPFTSESGWLDTTPPEITIVIPEPYGLYTVGVALDFHATDVSGVSTIVGQSTNTAGEYQEVESGFTPQPGVYTLVVVATDNRGNTGESDPVFFVIYDPEGGFATGGGWIHPDEESTLPGGKANFGFVAKYKQGSSTGHLEFQYNDADINLKSTTIDWLIISSVSAQFQGVATINSEGIYTFRVRVKDNGEPGIGSDEFNIKIWQGMDTEADPIHKAKNIIAGGNITIHKT